MDLLLFLMALLLVAYAVGEFVCRLFRRVPLWKSLKDLIGKIWGAVEGVG
jgi:hypothetical protein